MSESAQQLSSINQLTAYFPYFLMGSIVKRMKLNEMLFCNSYILYASAIIWSCSSAIHFPYSNFITTTAAIFVIINVCYKIEHQQLSGNHILEKIGQNTIYIYCFHYFVLLLMNLDFLNQSLMSINASLLIDVILSLIPTTFAILFSLFIKNIIYKESIIMKLIFNK